MTDHFCKLSLKFETLYGSLRSLAQIVFHAKFLFPEDNRLLLKKELKSLCPLRSTLYRSLDDQKPLEKQAFWLKSINNAYYYKSRQSYYKLRQLCLLRITTKCCKKLRLLFYYKLRQSSYKLRQLLQITAIITIYDKIIVKFSTKHFGQLKKKQF